MIKKHSIINFNGYRSILCLNGELPAVEFFESHLPIIAADGGANSLMQLGITPQMVIGDLDSVRAEYKERLNCLLHFDQNYNDFQKSMFYLEEQQLLPAIIVGINGGFLDHILNNISLFINTNCVLYAPPIIGYVLQPSHNYSFTLPLNTKISLLGIPAARITTQGLKWNLQDQSLIFAENNSCFNRSVDDTPSISVNEGRVLMLIYEREES